jgi:hypothetical protein
VPGGVMVGLGLVSVLFATACQRAALAWFVPTLQVRVAAHQTRQGLLGAPRRRAPWDGTVTAWLRFEPRSAASNLPYRAEFAAEAAVIPCELEDVACLEEFAESERTTNSLLGELD